MEKAYRKQQVFYYTWAEPGQNFVHPELLPSHLGTLRFGQGILCFLLLKLFCFHDGGLSGILGQEELR